MKFKRKSLLKLFKGERRKKNENGETFPGHIPLVPLEPSAILPSTCPFPLPWKSVSNEPVQFRIPLNPMTFRPHYVVFQWISPHPFDSPTWLSLEFDLAYQFQGKLVCLLIVISQKEKITTHARTDQQLVKASKYTGIVAIICNEIESLKVKCNCARFLLFALLAHDHCLILGIDDKFSSEQIIFDLFLRSNLLFYFGLLTLKYIYSYIIFRVVTQQSTINNQQSTTNNQQPTTNNTRKYRKNYHHNRY